MASDCSPADASVSPAAKEICDGLDQNCNGSTDELCTCPTGTTRVDLAVGFLCVPDLPVWGIGPDDPGPLLVVGSGPTAGTATDTVTGLMWQQTWDSGKNWLDAQKYCHAQVTGGFSDWRLPTIAELASVRNLTKAPMLPSAFSGPQGAMWSAVPSPGSFKPGWYYTLSGSHGLIEVVLGSTTAINYRCVRGMPAKSVPKVRFTYDKATSIASDALTGLQWYVQSKVPIIQPDAKLWCSTLQQDGKGWRLPKLQEVESLLNRANYLPALDPVMGSLNMSAHWSSNVHPSSGDGLLAGFNNSLSTMYAPTTTANAICVR